jgi:outer membrane protein TolC
MKTGITHLILITCLSLFSRSLSAQVLDLKSCLKMVDSTNLTLQNSRLDIQLNDQQRKVYLSSRYPKLIFSGDYKYNALIPGQVVPAAFFGGTPGTFTTVQFGVPFNLSNTLQLNQILYNPQLNYGLNALAINSEVVALQNQLNTLDVKQQVASTFFNLQAIYKQLAFLDSNLTNMEQLINNMEAMVAQDLVIQNEVDKLIINKLTIENAKSTLENSKLQLEDYMKLLLGMPFENLLNLATDSLVEKTLIIDNSEAFYPELELINTQKKLNVEERKGTKMAYLPNLSFYAVYNYNYNMKPQDDFRTGIEGAFIGLRLDWTLFDGLEKHYQLKMNAINAEKIDNQKEYTTQQLLLRTKNALSQIQLYSGSLNLAKEKLKLAESVYALAEMKLNEGMIGTTELILADNGLQEAQSNVIAAYIQLRQAELTYLRSLGILN